MSVGWLESAYNLMISQNQIMKSRSHEISEKSIEIPSASVMGTIFHCLRSFPLTSK